MNFRLSCQSIPQYVVRTKKTDQVWILPNCGRKCQPIWFRKRTFRTFSTLEYTEILPRWLTNVFHSSLISDQRSPTDNRADKSFVIRCLANPNYVQRSLTVRANTLLSRLRREQLQTETVVFLLGCFLGGLYVGWKLPNFVRSWIERIFFIMPFCTFVNVLLKVANLFKFTFFIVRCTNQFGRCYSLFVPK